MLECDYKGMPPDHQRVIMMEIAALSLPLAQGASSVANQPGMIFTKNMKIKDLESIIGNLACLMGGSVVYAVKPQKAKAKTVAKPKPKCKAKRGKGSKSMAKAKAKAKSAKKRKADDVSEKEEDTARKGTKTKQEVLASQTESMVPESFGREKRFLDDVFAALDAASAGYAVKTHFQDKISHACVCLCIIFGCTGSVDVSGGKPLTKWSVARPAI